MPSIYEYKIRFVIPGYLDVATGAIVPMTTSGGVDDETGVAVVASASGATQVVAANATKKIVVTSVVLVSNGTVNVKWQSAATDLTGLAYLVANTGFSTGYNPKGQFRTAVNEALNINLSGNIAVGGWLKYVLV